MYKRFMVLFALSALFAVHCSDVGTSPLDENGPNFVKPVITIDTAASSLKPNDTIHYDSATLVLIGNMSQSRFQVKVDSQSWSSWEPAGAFPVSFFSDGKHIAYISTMYQGGIKTFNDTIVFSVQTQGYRPLFSPMADTVISIDTGSATSLIVNATGLTPLMYQWYKGSSILTGKTDAEFDISSLALKDTGAYFCIASNKYGVDSSRIFSIKFRPVKGGIKGILISNKNSDKLSGVVVTMTPGNVKDTSDSNGIFALSGLNSGTYSISITLAGYQDYTKTSIIVNDSTVQDLSVIVLAMNDTGTANLKVTYDGNGNSAGSAPVDQSGYKSGMTVTVLGNTGSLVKTGYIFSGWNSKTDGSGTSYSPGGTFSMAASAITLYATWKIQPTLSITYDGNGKTGGVVPVDSNKYNVGDSVIALGNSGSLVKNGYSFAGWNTKSDGSGTDYNAGSKLSMPSSSAILYAKWTTQPTFSVIYNRNGADSGTAPASGSYVVGASVTVSDNTGMLKKIGCVFGGWNTKANGTGTIYAAGATFIKDSTNDTLWAKWTSYSYTIFFDGQNATIQANPASKTVTSPATTVDTLPTQPQRTGYTFAGWYTAVNGGGAQFKTTTTVTANDTVYAKWNAYSYTVFFDGKGATTPPSPVSRLVNSPATTLPADSLPTPPQKTGGYKFGGWYMDQNCTGAQLTTSTQFNTNDTVYAKWTKTFTLTITSSPTVGGSVTENPNTAIYDSGTSVTITPGANSGYRFNNWTGDYTGATNPAQITMNKDYAITANFLRQYTVNFTATPSGRGSITKPTTSSATLDSGVSLDIAATPATGFKFKQWTSSNAGVSFVSSTSASTKLSVTQNVSTVAVQAVFGCITFRKDFPYKLNSIVQGDDGFYGVLCEKSSNGVVVKLDINGDSLWEKTVCSIGIDGQAHLFPITKINNGFLAGAVSSDTVFCKIIGISPDAGTTPLFSWNPCVDFNINFTIFRAFQVNDGGYFLAGYDNDLQKTTVIKTDASRQKLWGMNFDSLNLINDCQQTKDNGFVMVDGNGWVVKINSTGTTTNFSTKIPDANILSVCQIGDADGFIVGGSSENAGCLIKILPNGAIASGWPKTFNNISYDITLVHVTSDGNFIFITDGGDFVKTNFNGDIIWDKKLTGTIGFIDSFYFCLANDGGFIIINNYSKWVMKTDENGDTD